MAETEDLLEHAGWIRALAGRLVGEDDADDLVQETWAAALGHGPRRAGPTGPWLSGVLRNLARMRGRSEANRGAREASVASGDPLPSANELAQRAELQRRLVDSVLRLEEPYRATLLLRYYEGLTPAEIARRRGEPAATIRSRLHRGVERLRSELDQEHGGREAWAATLMPLAFSAGAAAPALPLTGAVLMKGAVAGAFAIGVGLAVIVAMKAGGEEAEGGSELLAQNAGASEGVAGVDNAADGEPDLAAHTDLEDDLLSSAAAEVREGDPRGLVETEDDTSAVDEPTASFAGRVVDEETGEPVPFYRFDMVLGAFVVPLETDAEGRFASEEELPAGIIALDLVGDRHPKDLIQGTGKAAFTAYEWSRAHNHDPDCDPEAEGEVELALPIGPTYKLRIAAPDGAPTEGFEAGLRAADMRFAHDYIYGHVRTSPGGPWVRFSPLARLMGGGPPYRLKIMTSDGMWYGDVHVELLTGVHPEILDVELVARGAVKGRVLTSEGEPVVRRWVQLWGEGATFDTGDPNERPQLVLTDEEGVYHQRWIPPGRYTMKTDAPRHEDYEAEVEVRAGETLQHDVQLEVKGPNTNTGVVRGLVTSRTGRFHGAMMAGVSEKGGGARRSTTVKWKQEGETWTGSFEVKKLERVPHNVGVGNDGFLLIEPSMLEVEPDATGLEFFIEDDVALSDVHVRVIDVETGEGVKDFRSWLTVEPDTERDRFQYGASETGLVDYAGVPKEFPWEVRVQAEGYAMAWATFEQLDAETGEVVVALKRGWASRVTVKNPDGGRIAGVDVSFDDVLLGRTDANGHLTVLLEAEPETARFSYNDGGDWEVVGDSAYNTETGRFRSYLWWLNVTMRTTE